MIATMRSSSRNSETHCIVNQLYEFISDGPRNLSITRFEDHLKCSADGNPTPTYSWIYVETNRSTNGPILILDKALDSDKESNVECTAVNAFGTQRKSISLLSNDKMFFKLSSFFQMIRGYD